MSETGKIPEIGKNEKNKEVLNKLELPSSTNGQSPSPKQSPSSSNTARTDEKYHMLPEEPSMQFLVLAPSKTKMKDPAEPPRESSSDTYDYEIQKVRCWLLSPHSQEKLK